MSRYRKICPAIWNDEKFRLLSDDAKLTFFYLLTHPHQTSLGAMRAAVPGLAAEQGWSLQRFSRAFKGIESKRMVRHDPDASLVWLPNFLKYNGPENPNVVKSWAQALELIPECLLKHDLINHVKKMLEGLPEAFSKALPESFDKGMPIQEQEQEQKPEQDKPLTPSGNVSLVVSKINELSGKNFNPAAKESLRNLVARLKDHSLEEVLTVVEDRWRRWGTDPQMYQHFNPTTLFRPEKFSTYLVEAGAPGVNDSGIDNSKLREEWAR